MRNTLEEVTIWIEAPNVIEAARGGWGALKAKPLFGRPLKLDGRAEARKRANKDHRKPPKRANGRPRCAACLHVFEQNRASLRLPLNFTPHCAQIVGFFQ
jgi:hypothetical protein